MYGEVEVEVCAFRLEIVWEFDVEICTDVHIREHPMKLVGELVTTGLLQHEGNKACSMNKEVIMHTWWYNPLVSDWSCLPLYSWKSTCLQDRITLHIFKGLINSLSPFLASYIYLFVHLLHCIFTALYIYCIVYLLHCIFTALYIHLESVDHGLLHIHWLGLCVDQTFRQHAGVKLKTKRNTTKLKRVDNSQLPILQKISGPSVKLISHSFYNGATHNIWPEKDRAQCLEECLTLWKISLSSRYLNTVTEWPSLSSTSDSHIPFVLFLSRESQYLDNWRKFEQSESKYEKLANISSQQPLSSTLFNCFIKGQKSVCVLSI